MITVMIWGVVIVFYGLAAFLAVLVAGSLLWIALIGLRVIAAVLMVLAKPIIKLIKHV